MTSQRKQKKRAEALGITSAELQLVELLDEVLESMRWMQILAYSNQYLLQQKLKVSQAERDQILEAATARWTRTRSCTSGRGRLDRLKGEIVNIKRKVNRARRDMAQDKPLPPPPKEQSSHDG